jgi:hypothetical protein
MNAALGSWAFFLFCRRRFWIFAVRLWWHIQEPPHNAFHAASYFCIVELVF